MYAPAPRRIRNEPQFFKYFLPFHQKDILYVIQLLNQ
jgi:hypothetical protein